VVRLADVTDPSYLDGLEGWPLEDLRARKDEATEVETGLSYQRRIVQGRLDMVKAVLERREGGAAGDVSELVEDLPNILGDHVHAPGLGRLPTHMGPGQLDPELQAQLESVLPAARLAQLPEIPDEELESSSAALSELERTLSSHRRAVFDVLDHLQEEIVRRYQTGEATVDSLLS
jgi:hypothetical protein